MTGPPRARIAALALSGNNGAEDTLGVQLLADCQQVFANDSRLHTAHLLERLYALEESPWGEWALTPRRMAGLLRSYGVHSKSIRAGDAVRRGYERLAFTDAWNRYLPHSDAMSATSATSGTANAHSPDTATRLVAVRRATGGSRDAYETPMGACDVSLVSDVADDDRRSSSDDMAVYIVQELGGEIDAS